MSASGPVAHLHVHSEYSLLDGHCKIDALARRAAELEMPALALTDHGVMNGAVEQFKACRAHDVRPIMGLEAYYHPDIAWAQAHPKAKLNHLTLLARDNTGFKNLVKLTSSGFMDGFTRGKPVIDLAMLERHSEGVMALTGCLASPFCQALVDERPDDARQFADDLLRVVGTENVYFELQVNGLTEQEKANEGIARIARELGRPVVGTADVHYLESSDYDSHAALVCVQTKKTLADPKWAFTSNAFYLKDADEMARDFAPWPEAVPMTIEIAERCEVDIPLGDLLLPTFPTPDGEEPAAMLRRLATEGLRSRYGDPPPAAATERLEFELSVIAEMGFESYFLIVWDFVSYAKSSAIAVGPGRGSAAGSIVSYALGITDLDPLEHDLLFERFLNPARKSMPDIDIDFSVRGREKMIRYVTEKYGADSVAQIITFGKMAPRAATRDAARVLGLDYQSGDRVAKLIPEPVMGRSPSFDECLKPGQDLRKTYDTDPQTKEIVDTARGLEGIVRNNSIHAAAVVIADRPLTEIVPLQKAEDRSGPAEDGGKAYKTVTQYSMGPIEEIGLLKMDFLGLRNLDVIEDAVKIIRDSRGEKIDIEQIPLDDQQTFEMLSRADSIGVFQLESEGMRDAMRQVRPTEFADIVALVSLYRPGAMAYIPQYAKGKRNPDSVRYPDERLRSITEETYGCVIYQEQLMEIAKQMAGFSGAEADDLRKAIGKKKRELMATMESKFREGLAASGTEPAVSDELWALNRAAADYSFNKSHAACYAMIAYRTAYLKANYPAEYMAAVISSVMSTKDKVPFFVNRCEAMGIEVLPPDVNVSSHSFAVSGNSIRFGLDAVKNVGHAAVEAIIRAREKGGPIASLYDFCERVDARAANKKTIESLICCGALDSTRATRKAMLDALPQAQAAGQRTQADAHVGQVSIFGEAGAEAGGGSSPQHPPIVGEEFDRRELLRLEKETMGTFLSEHPLAEVRDALEAEADCTLAELEGKADGTWVTVGGIIGEAKKIRTRSGTQMMFATLDDLEGQVEMIVFEKVLAEAGDALAADRIVIVRGRIDHKDAGETKLVVQEARPFEPTDDEVAAARKRAAAREAERNRPMLLQIEAARFEPQILAEIRDLLSRHPGDSPVIVEMRTREGVKRLRFGEQFCVSESPALRAQIASLLETHSLAA